jgi:8-oxo-dGTP pyrophosphatase MutT (NUDIX family)
VQEVDRQAARVLLVDAEDRVLLLAGRDPDDASAGTWWFTPGGGLDPGETQLQAAVRELAEETGLRARPEDLGEPVHERVARFAFGGLAYRQSEVFYLLRVDAHEVDTAGFTEVERAAVTGHRWWPRPELVTTQDTVYPRDLDEVLARALSRGALP